MRSEPAEGTSQDTKMPLAPAKSNSLVFYLYESDENLPSISKTAKFLH